MGDTPLQFAESLNGDRWFLVRTQGVDDLQVLHRPNAASGGATSRLSIDDFLVRSAGAPENQALLEFLGMLISDRFDVQIPGRDEMIMRFRDATGAEVAEALAGSKVRLPIGTSHEALEFFNCMVDVLTGLRQIENDERAKHIPAGFGSTH